MDVRFYLNCFRTEALIASQLPPEKFGAYMAVGTKKLIHGIVMFFEIDPSFSTDAIDFEGGRKRCKTKEDGRPKQSKYVSIYRVLEHIPLKALGKLHLVTRDGRDLTLEPQKYIDTEEPKETPHLYAELCPISPRVVATLPPAKFANYLTSPDNPVHVPRVFFAEQILDFDEDGNLASYLPYRPAQHLTDCVKELIKSGKLTKTVDRNPPLAAFYRTVKPGGFFVGDQTGVIHYPYPKQRELDDKHYHWWKSASLGV